MNCGGAGTKEVEGGRVAGGDLWGVATKAPTEPAGGEQL